MLGNNHANAAAAAGGSSKGRTAAPPRSARSKRARWLASGNELRDWSRLNVAKWGRECSQFKASTGLSGALAATRGFGTGGTSQTGCHKKRDDNVFLSYESISRDLFFVRGRA
jgi:hypothetical protein